MSQVSRSLKNIFKMSNTEFNNSKSLVSFQFMLFTPGGVRREQKS